MAPPIELGQVIAERRFLLLPNREVIVRLGLPFTPDEFPDESWCPYQIIGLGSSKVRRAVGIDAFQSLRLAMEMLGSALYGSEEYKAGRLYCFEGDPDLCLPVFDSCRDLLPDLPPPPSSPTI